MWGNYKQCLNVRVPDEDEDDIDAEFDDEAEEEEKPKEPKEFFCDLLLHAIESRLFGQPRFHFDDTILTAEKFFGLFGFLLFLGLIIEFGVDVILVFIRDSNIQTLLVIAPHRDRALQNARRWFASCIQHWIN